MTDTIEPIRIRGTVVRTREGGEKNWTAEIVEKTKTGRVTVLVDAKDFPLTETGRVAALTWASYRVSMHYAEEFGICLICNGTGQADNCGVRCGWCNGTGAIR